MTFQHRGMFRWIFRFFTFAVVFQSTFGLVPQQKSSSSVIQVWDNVIPAANRANLHIMATRSGLGHCVFSRQDAQVSLSPMERALDEILSQLGDDSKFVEYWCRQDWRHIEAHADVDEHLAKEQDKSRENGFRYPESGHVLYLQVGDQVRGPTCLFPNCVQGGDLTRNDSIEFVSVPAVAGRLLRFRGNMLHAVPRPTDIWFLPFVRGAPQFQPEESWGRSVILFNTWDAQPPKDVIMNKHADVADTTGDLQDSDSLCNEYASWDQLDIRVGSEDSEETTSAKIWLLGNERRRDHPLRTVKVLAPREMEVALQNPTRPSKMILTKHKG